MPSASATTATTVKPGRLSSILNPYRRSLRKVSIRLLLIPGANAGLREKSFVRGLPDQLPCQERFGLSYGIDLVLMRVRPCCSGTCAAVGKANLRIRNPGH